MAHNQYQEPAEPAVSPAGVQEPCAEIEDLLAAWNQGQEGARERLVAAIYPALRRLAGAHLARWSGEVSLQATELVHELYFKLLGQTQRSWQNRAQLFAVLSRLTRQLLVDHARHRSRQKRGGALETVPLEASMLTSERREIDIVALDQALAALAAIDEKAVQVVEVLFFAGLTHDEAAFALGVGRATVGRKWRFARAWLQQRLAA